MPSILIIPGTHRKGSMSAKIADLLHSKYQNAGATVDSLDLRDVPPECYLPTAYGKGRPASFLPFQEKVLNADGIVFIVPEYNGSYPGILKHFIDLWSYPESFENRRVTYVGVAAGQWGGLRAVEHLQGVMGYRNARQFPMRIFINYIYDRWDWETGVLKKKNVKEEDLNGLLLQQCKGFIDFCSS